MKTKKMEKKLVLNKTTITTVNNEIMKEVNGGAHFTLGDCFPSGPSYCFATCENNGCGDTDFIECTMQIGCN